MMGFNLCSLGLKQINVISSSSANERASRLFITAKQSQSVTQGMSCGEAFLETVGDSQSCRFNITVVLT